ncbi:hypothetical protein RIVM261_063460 [Rivularia sp. IAM M-261]|nr:hypothetical protein CAL7716_049790 [Calothrix sp. PCC 7716]GJD21390.1 hypothetical protein RIVM261_063460 [Rivularia sp. IAM M-261]
MSKNIRHQVKASFMKKSITLSKIRQQLVKSFVETFGECIKNYLKFSKNLVKI